MIAVANIELVMENGSVTKVRCTRCHAEIGRVQVRAPAEDEDPELWEDEVRGELEVLAQEHDLDCPAAAHPPAEPPVTDLGEHREKP
jgi:hypothetical protein